MCSPKYIEIEFLVHMCIVILKEIYIFIYLFIYLIGNGFDTDPDPGGSRCPCHASFIKEFSTAESAKSGRLGFLLINKRWRCYLPEIFISSLLTLFLLGILSVLWAPTAPVSVLVLAPGAGKRQIQNNKRKLYIV